LLLDDAHCRDLLADVGILVIRELGERERAVTTAASQRDKSKEWSGAA